MTSKPKVKPKHKAGIEFYKDRNGKHRWRLRGRNGKITCDCSEGYSTLANAKKGLRSTAKTINLWMAKN